MSSDSESDLDRLQEEWLAAFRSGTRRRPPIVQESINLDEDEDVTDTKSLVSAPQPVLPEKRPSSSRSPPRAHVPKRRRVYKSVPEKTSPIKRPTPQRRANTEQSASKTRVAKTKVPVQKVRSEKHAEVDPIHSPVPASPAPPSPPPPCSPSSSPSPPILSEPPPKVQEDEHQAIPALEMTPRRPGRLQVVEEPPTPKTSESPLSVAPLQATLHAASPPTITDVKCAPEPTSSQQPIMLRLPLRPKKRVPTIRIPRSKPPPPGHPHYSDTVQDPNLSREQSTPLASVGVEEAQPVQLTGNDDPSASAAADVPQQQPQTPRTHVQIEAPVPDYSNDDIAVPSAPLNSVEQNYIHEHYLLCNREKIATRIPNHRHQLTGYDLFMLSRETLISDEVVNAFSVLLNNRNRDYFATSEYADTASRCSNIREYRKGHPQHMYQGSRPRLLMVSTFFYTCLMSGSAGPYNYDRVRRWMRNDSHDIGDIDILLVPVHFCHHWVLVAIDIRNHVFLYMDTLRMVDKRGIISNLKRWLADEVTDIYGADAARRMRIRQWCNTQRPGFVPLQDDEVSCGLYMMYMAESIERRMKPTVRCMNSALHRERLVLYFIRGFLPVGYTKMHC